MKYRRQIRETTVTLLKAANTAAGQRVFPTRLDAVEPAELPAIGVYTPREAGESLDAAEPTFRNRLDLVIELKVGGGEAPELDGSADDLCEEIEGALLREPAWVGLFGRFPEYTVETDYEQGGSQRTLGQTLRLTCTWDESHEPKVDDLFERLRLRVDLRDPAADPNTGNTVPGSGGEDPYPGGYPGPDGRTEAEAEFEIEQE